MDMIEYEEVLEGENKVLDEVYSEFRKVFSRGVRWGIFEEDGEFVLGLIDFETSQVLIIGREEEK
ncbi:triacylglycerol esterase/lipase EstA (alpha/beta hydrolase family) [Paenibacillus sp. 1182]|uniref:hypothetical protein n=1 Tax=Paenibacillus sp. 1182 TaxID=2806565 RepID=UPI001AE76BA6|nr:hypothetical protein [Paenibacillus sp. 1182]MBP1309180.1 triacylglycerol esterase/lipase EstA (alpha/beta hydrolase family) [Paenibacillus sp. 1182]